MRLVSLIQDRIQDRILERIQDRIQGRIQDWDRRLAAYLVRQKYNNSKDTV